jgi:hypothetical protein
MGIPKVIAGDIPFSDTSISSTEVIGDGLRFF